MLLATLQQCSGTEKQNAAVAIKRLAAAVDAEPDIRWNHPCASSSSLLSPRSTPAAQATSLASPTAA